MSDDYATDKVTLATELTIAWLANANNRVNADDVPAFLSKMYETVQQLSGETTQEAAVEEAPARTPAVTARKSLSNPDHIVSMIDGKAYKTLRRHLSTHGMTPEQYRETFGLKADYPMVAPNYSESRRAMAKKIGLGRKPKEVPVEAPVKAKAPRKPAAPKATTAEESTDA